VRSWTSLIVALSWLMALPAERHISASGAASDADALAVDRFINDIEKEPVPYQAVRRLEASSSKLQESAWMEVRTEYSRENGFRYEVVSQGGSERIRNRALYGVLEGEKASTARWRRGALTRENYDFVYESRTADGLIKIQLSPRRRDPRLLEGAAWVSAQSGDLVRLEGRLAKSPSFWVRWVSVTRRYVPIRGAIMPAAMESTADVKIAGVSRFSMTYTYAVVDGQRIGAPGILPDR
jgi:hypothetical protein